MIYFLLAIRDIEPFIHRIMRKMYNALFWSRSTYFR